MKSLTRIILSSTGVCILLGAASFLQAQQIQTSSTPVLPGATTTISAGSNTTGEAFDPDAELSLLLPVRSSDNLSFGAVAQVAPTPEDHPEGASASELNQKLSNPVSNLWSISNQFNNFDLESGHWNNNWNFQPVLPISLTNDWNLITRPVMPFYNIVPHPTLSGEWERDAGLGDLALVELLSPAHSGHWLLGVGPTAIFPTATSGFTGQGKWQLGPTLLVGYMTKDFILGVFPQQWWSIGGQHGKPDTNQLNLQPIASIFFGEGWNIGYSGNILANFNAAPGNVWTVPIGVGVGKVVKFGRLPVKLQLAVQYMPVRPDVFGQEWNVQIQITPVLPKLIKGTLFH
jgi:hypothetical protein